LAWIGYEESDYLKSLERAVGQEVSVQTYLGGEQMYQLLSQAPAGTYDAVIVDAEFGKKLFQEGKLDHLEQSDWFYEDYLPVFRSGDPVRLNNSVFGVVARWGALGLVYNTQVFSAEEVKTYSALFSDKANGRVGILDWYLPSMGVLSKYLGFKPPYDLDDRQLKELQQVLLKLRPRVKSIQATPGGVMEDLRSGRTVITPGIGEWAAAALRAERRPIDYVIPKEGGIMWVEAFAIPATAQNKSRTKAFIRAAMQPEVLAPLASRQAYFSQLTRASAYQFIPEPIRRSLRTRSADNAEQIAQSLEFRQLPGPRTSEAQWLEVWDSFKTQK
jgi:spermidine/putrescine transport system substrate-binding protein